MENTALITTGGEIKTTNPNQWEVDPVQMQVWQKISELKGKMLANDPTLPGHLKAIHSALIQYEELTHLLSDEQIREIIVAQKVVTNVALAPKLKAVSEKSLLKQAKDITAADL